MSKLTSMEKPGSLTLIQEQSDGHWTLEAHRPEQVCAQCDPVL